MRISIVLFFIAFFVSCSELCTAQKPESGTPVIGTISEPELRIGDQVDILVYDNPDLSGHFRIDEDGDLNLPLLGRVHVAGTQTDKLAGILEDKYRAGELLQAPEVSVELAETISQKITITGEVKVPGVFPVYGPRELNDAIAGAGGVTPFASTTLIITPARDPGHPIKVDYDPSGPTPNLSKTLIFPGDTITVPSAGTVIMMGAVNRPGSFAIEGHQALTAERALALAGGPGGSAKLNRSHLIRTNPDGTKEDIEIALGRVLDGKNPDVALRDGDILYVPSSLAKTAGMSFMQTVIGGGTGALIYRIVY